MLQHSTSSHRSPAWLDAMYNNRALVPQYADHFARWSRDSEVVRAGQACVLDLAYGSGSGETLDIFPAPATGRPAPVLVFVHGGYWRSLDKADHSFVAPTFTRRGACVVLPNYALCPGTEDAPVHIPHICLQMVRALAWTYRHIAAYGGDPSRILVAGHSAGGHLAAMLLACDWPAWDADLPPDLVRRALSISGLYELDSLRTTPFLRDSLRLTADDVLRCSPAWFPAPRQGRFYTVAGGDESAEFLRHNRLIRQAWGRSAVPVCETLPGLNHFSIVEALTQPGHRLHQLAEALVR